MRGNITRRGKHSWRIKFDLDREPSGERQVRYVTVKGTRKDAEAELTRLLNDADRGVLVDPTTITVAKHLHDWLDGKDSLSPLSHQRYSEIIERQINPTLGEIELQKLKPRDVQAWLDWAQHGGPCGLA